MMTSTQELAWFDAVVESAQAARYAQSNFSFALHLCVLQRLQEHGVAVHTVNERELFDIEADREVDALVDCLSTKSADIREVVAQALEQIVQTVLERNSVEAAKGRRRGLELRMETGGGNSA